jgi:hypothetical protein
MRKLTVTVTMPVTLEIDVEDNASDAQLLVKILEHASEIDPRDHDGFVIQEVLDSRENNSNIIMRILDVQDEIEAEELEEKHKNNYYYHDIESLF